MNAQNDFAQLMTYDYLYCISFGGPFNCSTEQKIRINPGKEYLINIVLSEIMVKKPHWGFCLRTC